MDIQKESEAYLKMLVGNDAISNDQADTLKLMSGGSHFYTYGNQVSVAKLDLINWGWNSWVNAKSQVVNQSVILSCQQLKEALEFGAPDLFSETKGQESDLEFQLETEMSIEFMKDGHSGSGYYCWYYDLPEEGSIILGEEAQEQSHD